MEDDIYIIYLYLRSLLFDTLNSLFILHQVYFGRLILLNLMKTQFLTKIIRFQSTTTILIAYIFANQAYMHTQMHNKFP